VATVIAGMMMRAQALLQKNPKPTDAQIRAELEPHLCRCGTHMRILRAVHRAAHLMDTAELVAGHPGECAMNVPVILDVGACSRARCIDRQLPMSDALAQDQAAPATAPQPPGSLATSSYLDSWIRIDATALSRCSPAKPSSARLEDSFQQIAAEELDVPFASLKVVTADTRRTANEGYTSGSIQ